jgi:Uma2 family endonuclease
VVTVCQSPLDVRFAPGRILQPDAFVIFGRVAPSHQGPIDRIPALCVEVLSDNRLYDRVTKRLLYAVAGVKELWVVDPERGVERWTGKGLASNAMVSGRLQTPLLPGFALDVRRLVAGSRRRSR